MKKKSMLFLGTILASVTVGSISVGADQTDNAINQSGRKVDLVAPQKAGKSEAESTLSPIENDSYQNKGKGFYTVNSYENNSSYSSQVSDDDYVLLGVTNYDQYAEGAPSGCEGASLLQALQYKGKLKDWGLVQFLNTIIKSPDENPNTGFVGSPFVEDPNVYSAIYPDPLTTWGQRYGNVQNISGSSMNDLINEVAEGNPVVAWVTINFQPVRWGDWPFGAAVNNNHAVTLDGFDKTNNQVHVSDPISGSYWLSRSTFETIYNARKYAVVVK